MSERQIHESATGNGAITTTDHPQCTTHVQRRQWNVNKPASNCAVVPIFGWPVQNDQAHLSRRHQQKTAQWSSQAEQWIGIVANVTSKRALVEFHHRSMHVLCTFFNVSAAPELYLDATMEGIRRGLKITPLSINTSAITVPQYGTEQGVIIRCWEDEPCTA